MAQETDPFMTPKAISLATILQRINQLREQRKNTRFEARKEWLLATIKRFENQAPMLGEKLQSAKQKLLKI